MKAEDFGDNPKEKKLDRKRYSKREPWEVRYKEKKRSKKKNTSERSIIWIVVLASIIGAVLFYLN